MLAEPSCASPLPLGLDLPSLERWHSADAGVQARGSVAAGSSTVAQALVAVGFPSPLPPARCKPTALAPSTALPTLLHVHSCPVKHNGKREATRGENPDDSKSGKEPEK